MPDDKSTEPQDSETHLSKGIVDNKNMPQASDKRAIVEKVVQALRPGEKALSEAAGDHIPQAEPPWTLQQFFNGEIDLDVELSTRFSNVPLMSNIKFRGLGTRTGRGVATISTPDGSAQVVVDADKTTKVVQMSFTWGAMMTLRFTLHDLSDMDRSRWLELMRRRQGGLAFLWGPSRWENDYVICISRRYFTNLYSFSPNGFEASIRMTPDVTERLLNWLDDYWKANPDDEDDTEAKLLTW